MKTPRFRTFSTAVVGLVCITASVIGVKLLASYENTAGAAGSPPTEWPAASALPLASTGPTLLMLLHPRCPCTAASLRELEEVLAHAQGKLAARLIFAKPEGAPAGWERGPLWDHAERIPGVEVVCDESGAETARFSAATSGHTLLFAADGRLLFSGGITGARGHSGENAGRNALLALAHAAPAATNRTAVFGCPLTESTP